MREAPSAVASFRRPIHRLFLALLTDALVGRTLCARVDDDVSDDVRSGQQDEPTVLGVDLDRDGKVERQWTADLAAGPDAEEDAAKLLSVLAGVPPSEVKQGEITSATGYTSSLAQNVSNNILKSSVIRTGGTPVGSEVLKRSAESPYSDEAVARTEKAIKAIEVANRAKRAVRQALTDSVDSIRAVRSARGHVAPVTLSEAAEAAAEASENVLALAAAAEEASKGARKAIVAAATTPLPHEIHRKFPDLKSSRASS